MQFHITIPDIIDIVLVAIILFQLYADKRYSSFQYFYRDIYYLSVLACCESSEYGADNRFTGTNCRCRSNSSYYCVSTGGEEVFTCYREQVYYQQQIFTGQVFLSVRNAQGSPREAEEIVRACERMASNKTGALIVIGRKSNPTFFLKEVK